MVQFTFFGRVLPEVRRISIPRVVEFDYSEPNGTVTHFEINIAAARIFARASSTSEEASISFDNATVRALEFCNTLVDLIAFQTGWALSVVLDVGLLEAEMRPLVLSERSVAKFCTVFNDETSYSDVISAVLPNLPLRMALNDLNASVSRLNYSAIACFRAVESIRHAISESTHSRSEAWQKLRDILRIEKDFLDPIAEASIGPRHGDRGKVEGDSQLEVTRRAWIIVDRYLKYLMRGGSEPLPEDEFPLLSA